MRPFKRLIEMRVSNYLCRSEMIVSGNQAKHSISTKENSGKHPCQNAVKLINHSLEKKEPHKVDSKNDNKGLR